MNLRSIHFVSKRLPIRECPTGALILLDGRLGVVGFIDHNARHGYEPVEVRFLSEYGENADWTEVSENEVVEVLSGPVM